MHVGYDTGSFGKTRDMGSFASLLFYQNRAEQRKKHILADAEAENKNGLKF
jgi:hypothetical protein